MCLTEATGKPKTASYGEIELGGTAVLFIVYTAFRAASDQNPNLGDNGASSFFPAAQQYSSSSSGGQQFLFFLVDHSVV